MKTKKIWVLTLLLLLSLVLLTACGGKNEIKYAEDLASLSSELTEALVPFDDMDPENPESVTAAISAIDKAIPLCDKIAALEAPNSFEDIQKLFAQGAECYSLGLGNYRTMLTLPAEEEETYVTLSMAGSELLMEGADYFQQAFDKLKSELE